MIRETLRNRLSICQDLDRQDKHQSHTRIVEHSKVAAVKPAFLDVIRDIQTSFLDSLNHNKDSSLISILEVGSGVIPLSSNGYLVVSSDIQVSNGVNVCIDGTAIGLKTASFNYLFCQNSFHHFESLSRFLVEASRILRPGGKVYLVEPSFSLLARIVYPRLFDSETYIHDLKLHNIDDVQKSNRYPNQASSYVLFVKNLSLLIDSLPFIESVSIRHLPSGLRYLLTGGLNFRSLAPKRVLSLLRRFEGTTVGCFMLSKLSLHWLVEIQFR